jgi:general secretion pathway protein H
MKARACSGLRRGNAPCRAMASARGMTLIEIMIVLTIVASVMGLTAFSMSGLTASKVRSEALHVAGAVRYVYGRSAINGVRYQLTFAVGGNTLSAQCSEKNIPVASAETTKEREKASKEDGEANPFGVAGGAGTMAACDDTVIRDFTLKDGVTIARVVTSHDEAPVESGDATIGFFPNGFVERSMIWVKGADGGYFTLIVDPMSGRVRVKPGDLEVPDDFFEVEED